jgi:NitT/TauT family transport system permease protein
LPHPAARALRSAEPLLLPAALALVLLLLWHASVRWTGTSVFPSPREVAAGLLELLRRGVLLGYTADSLRRVALGYALGALLGVPLGLLMGWFPAVFASANPIVQLLRPISPLAWIPVAIVLFGISEGATVFLIFLASVFPIAVATCRGVQTVPEMFRRAGQNFALSRRALLLRVVLPAAAPQILVGMRIALGVAWLVVVAAEMIAVDSGLGYLVIDARNAGKRYDLVVAAMGVIGVLGLLLNLAIRRLERLPALRWGFRAAD